MSALAMILTVAVVISDGDQAKVSAEMAQELDLRGEWAGVLRIKGKETEGEGERKMTIKNGRMQARGGMKQATSYVEILFSREGKVRFKWLASTYHAIYQQQGDRLMLCLRQDDGDGKGSYPTSFRASTDQALIIFHRVKFRE